MDSPSFCENAVLAPPFIIPPQFTFNLPIETGYRHVSHSRTQKKQPPKCSVFRCIQTFLSKTLHEWPRPYWTGPMTALAGTIDEQFRGVSWARTTSLCTKGLTIPEGTLTALLFTQIESTKLEPSGIFLG